MMSCSAEHERCVLVYLIDPGETPVIDHSWDAF